jgi:putative oxidoreductase
MTASVSAYEKVLSWIARISAAAIYLQTLYFKFSGAPESVYIFSALGAEPVGRIGSGVAELIVAVLLLIPRTASIGGVFSLGLIGAHLFVLGIEVQGDGGLLFGLATLIAVLSALTIWLHRRELPFIGDRF